MALRLKPPRPKARKRPESDRAEPKPPKRPEFHVNPMADLLADVEKDLADVEKDLADVEKDLADVNKDLK